MTASSPQPADPADPRLLSGEAWDRFCQRLLEARRLVLGPEVPDSPRDRAEGFRYLARFLSAGLLQCVTHADPDYPVFARMMDYTMPWGLDNPDCLYLYAPVRGNASYRIHGQRGSANHFDLQVNYGHFADGDIAKWGTISSVDGFGLALDPDGSFELTLSAERQEGNWLPLESNAEFVLVRQYFNDWENEQPADLMIERVGARYPIPPPRTDQLAAQLERLSSWLEKGGALWERMSQGLLSMEPNTLVVHLPESSDRRAGLRGQAYGMGNFRCAADEAVILEFTPPECHHWSVGLANAYWESLEFASRQTSLNGHQAHLDPDGVFRAVIAHQDPGVPNWLDPAGHTRGTLAIRFLLASAAPKPALRVVPARDVRSVLHPDTPRLDPAERATILERRRHAVIRRYRR